MVLFFIIAILVAILLVWLPTVITMDPQAWNLIRGLAIIALLVFAFVTFWPMVRAAVG